MRMNSCSFWKRVAFENPIFISTRPGRTRAGSSASGWLLVKMSTRPSCEATPSMVLSRPDKEMPFSSPDHWGGLLSLALKISSRLLKTGHPLLLLGSAKAWWHWLQLCLFFFVLGLFSIC